MTQADLTLESRIDFAVLALASSESPEARRDAWAKLRDLIRQRSQERIREMERERGLAA